MSIPLHRKRGLDPHMMFCPRCGGEGDGITIGHIMKARHNGQWHYAPRNQRTKHERQYNLPRLDWMDVKEHERVPDFEPCGKCKEEIKEHAAIVEDGGLYFRCEECGSQGVIKPNDSTREIRMRVYERGDIEHINDPFGITFDTCEQHTRD